MKVLTKIAPILCVLLLIGPSHGQNPADTASTMIGLPGVMIYVEPMAEDVVERGITEDVLFVEIERVLKESGIPILNHDEGEPVPGRPTLNLEVNAVVEEHVDQIVFSLRLELRQSVYLLRQPGVEVFDVPTWGIGGVASYSKGWRQSIIEDVVSFSEEFASAFVATNPKIVE